MIIAELGGGGGGGGAGRQLPVVHVPSVRGGEGESLGIKDILS